MLILILFHLGGFRCLKHSYLGCVCRHIRHPLPRVGFYSLFVELEKKVPSRLYLFVKNVLLLHRYYLLRLRVTAGGVYLRAVFKQVYDFAVADQVAAQVLT